MKKLIISFLLAVITTALTIKDAIASNLTNLNRSNVHVKRTNNNLLNVFTRLTGDTKTADIVMNQMYSIFKSNQRMSDNTFKNNFLKFINRARRKKGLAPVNTGTQDVKELFSQINIIRESFSGARGGASASVAVAVGGAEARDLNTRIDLRPSSNIKVTFDRALKGEEGVKRLMLRMQKIYDRDRGMSTRTFENTLFNLINEVRRQQGLSRLSRSSKEFSQISKNISSIRDDFDLGKTEAGGGGAFWSAYSK